jgi:hypothetical protein
MKNIFFLLQNIFYYAKILITKIDFLNYKHIAVKNKTKKQLN